MFEPAGRLRRDRSDNVGRAREFSILVPRLPCWPKSRRAGQSCGSPGAASVAGRAHRFQAEPPGDRILAANAAHAPAEEVMVRYLLPPQLAVPLAERQIDQPASCRSVPAAFQAGGAVQFPPPPLGDSSRQYTSNSRQPHDNLVGCVVSWLRLSGLGFSPPCSGRREWVSVIFALARGEATNLK